MKSPKIRSSMIAFTSTVPRFVAKRGDPMRAITEKPLRSFAPVLCLVLFASLSVGAQGQTNPTPAEKQADLGGRLDVLTHSMEQMQGELEQARQEIQELRGMLAQILRTQANPP